MKKILFPFEINSPAYKDAYVYAVKFARRYRADLILLNVFDFEVDNSITQKEYNELIKKNWLIAYNEVFRFHEYYIKNFSKVQHELKISTQQRFVYGDMVLEVRKILKEEQIDLIVLPACRIEEFSNRQTEIIKHDLFEKNRASLLVVPELVSSGSINNIVFATDLKKINAPELYLSKVNQIADLFAASIHFLHISKKENASLPEDVETYRSIMKILKTNKKHRFSSIFGEGVVASINAYVSENEIDLLTVVRHDRFFLETLFHESMSEQLSLTSKIPVLIMKELDSF